MNLFLFFLTIIVLFIVFRIGAIAFELTGMAKEQATFQAISCFTNTGFTTSEAELVTSHPQRRRIASYLMIFGSAGIVTLIATFANTIRPVEVLDHLKIFNIDLPISKHYAPYINIGIILIGIYLIYKIVTKSRIIDRLNKRIKSGMVEKKIVKPEKFTELLVAPEGYGVFQFELRAGNLLIKKDLKHLHLKEDGVQVLIIERAGDVIATPKGDFIFEKNDRLTCFGKLVKMRELAGDSSS
ncbi:MAG: hypothetical protein KKB81_07875 [Candidatus Margulisbacteria bacterium]|nr:hypothetical protein [Candidatus Margulisiibacteriota bacterium]MBU1021788.1 hypothetical protein [Candidatus Margulisiibacteriota bacterium]MBU1729534.1 hypothetical protein [Candidatus Margulisiibacteriota bacterium]MBU1955365.1 hypothetical protein [Candidatus Margulisiibacteriota bacterium]